MRNRQWAHRAGGIPDAVDCTLLSLQLLVSTVMQLVDQGKLNLDTPLKDDLDNPLPSYGPDQAFPDKYGPYKDLAGDSRWETITPRMCLTHSTGFSNFWFVEPDQKLHIHYEPGTHFSYSGEGFVLLQFGAGHAQAVEVGPSLVWSKDNPDPNVADGWNDQGQPQPHEKRSKVRAWGSMNTTISDLPKFVAALMSGDGLSAASRAEITKPSLHITTAHQFPMLLPDLPVSEQRKDLYAGLGVVVFDGPQGHGFYKGGHDDQTANTVVCIEAGQRCVVILSNDVRFEAGFSDLVRFMSAIPEYLMTGNMATTPESRELAVSLPELALRLIRS
jgi:CubicO group peptidase (beta-lactamase class C family)